jgi:hypothetical protein
MHPGAKIPVGDKSENDLMNVIPGPFAVKPFRAPGQVFHKKFLTFREQVTGSVMYIRSSILSIQVRMVERF